MIALKENETLASSVGIDVTRYLVLAAVVSAAMAGAAGSLYAHYLKIIDPDIFLFIYTVTMVIMVITGGKGTLAGPIVGGSDFRFPAGHRALLRSAGRAVDPLRRPDDRHRVCPAAGHRACVERWAANWSGLARPVTLSCRPARKCHEPRTRQAGRRSLDRARDGAFRRPYCHLRSQFRPCKRGRDRRPDRAERRRQDHGVQCHHRLSQAHQRQRALSHHVAERTQAARNRQPSAWCERSSAPAYSRTTACSRMC